MKKTIAFFDFDGTITTKDTLLEITRFVKGDFSFILGFSLLSPWLIAMKLKLVSNTKTKERFLRYFFGGMPVAEFKKNCERFANEKIPALIRPKAMEEIQKHLRNGSEVVIVSASPENYISLWCAQHNISCIATRLETIDGLVTGKLQGKNCHGDEKVRRIHHDFNLPDYEEVYAYGDSSGDEPMLALANFSFYKPFRE